MAILLLALEKQTGIYELSMEVTSWQSPEGGLQEVTAILGWQQARKQGSESYYPKELNSANNHVNLEEGSNLHMRP